MAEIIIGYAIIGAVNAFLQERKAGYQLSLLNDLKNVLLWPYDLYLTIKNGLK